MIPRNPKVFDKQMYVTDILVYELRKEMVMLGHSVDIAYIPINSMDGKRLCIEELGIDVTYHTQINSSLWFMLVNNETNKFILVDLQDSPGITLILQRFPNFVLSLVGQFSLERYYRENKDLDLTKLKLVQPRMIG